MTLKRKVLTLYTALSVVILGLVGGALALWFRFQRLDDLRGELSNQLKHLDFALTSFIVEAENNVAALAANSLVRTRADEEFTNFLDADPATFSYQIGLVEQEIIDLFNTFRVTHPYVNSVYMGRENGSFVRSHPRAAPTQYDPRDRPWYTLAREHPGEIVRTAPYAAVTTADVNIGIVTALVDENADVYGVVGTDITLKNLTAYLSSFEVGHQGRILLLDQNGTILASHDPELHFASVDPFLDSQTTVLLTEPEGMLQFRTESSVGRLFFYTSPYLSWKIAILIPENEIQREVWATVLPELAGLLLALVLFGSLTFIVLNRAVIVPILQLHDVARDITRTGNLDQRVEIQSEDEIGSLGTSFNQMVVSIRKAQKELREERDLAEALKDAAATLTTTLDFESVLDRILEQVSSVIPNEACNFMLIEAGRVSVVRWLGYEAFHAAAFMNEAELSLAGTPSLQQMATSKEPILIPDVADEPTWQEIPEMSWLRSYAATPIIVRDHVIGFLSVDSAKPGFFQESCLEPLRSFAGYAAAAIENARLYEQVMRDAEELETRVAAATEALRQRAAEMTALNELSRALTRHLSVEQVLMETYRGVARLMPATHFEITLYDTERDQVSVMLSIVDGEVVQRPSASRGALTNHLIRDHQPLLLSDNVAGRIAELGIEGAAALEDNPARSWLGVPIILGEKVLGTLVVQSYTSPGIYQERERSLLWALANQAAVAIHNAQLYHQSEQHAVELEILYEVGERITATLSLDEMLQIIVDYAAQLVNADRSLVVLLNTEREKLVDIVGHGYSQAQLQAHTFEELQSGITGWVIQEKIPTFTNDLQKDPRQQGLALQSVRRSGDQSAAIAPLLIEEQVLGTLTLINGPAKPAFTSADLNLVTMLASLAAASIQKAQLYQAAQEADRLKSAFLASMSHELRTPLNSIIGFTGILLQGLVGDLNEEQHKQLGMVMNSARHLLALINDVLDISKIEAGGLDLAEERFDMRQAIERVAQAISPLVDRKGLELIVEVAPEVGPFMGDQRRVEQILINLANNAIKFTDEGYVRIKSEIVGGQLVTQVTDTGIGIRPEDVRKLFKPFRQIDTGIARMHEGTGLGLAICDRLVTMMNGKIWVESQWGEGSTFTFTLPMVHHKGGQP